MSTEQKDDVSVSKTTISHLIVRALNESVEEIGKHLEGKLLTFADATFSDPEQRKAFKDVLRGILLDCYYTRQYRATSDLYDSISGVLEGEQGHSHISGNCCPTSVYIDKSKLDFKYIREEV